MVDVFTQSGPQADIPETRFAAFSCAKYQCIAHPRDAPGGASTRFPVTCAYGFGIQRRLYDAFFWQPHGDRSADTEPAL